MGKEEIISQKHLHFFHAVFHAENQINSAAAEC